MAKKALDPKAKAKRQKLIAIGGGVLLVLLLAFEIPHTLKLMRQVQGTSSSAPATTTSTTTPAPAAPTDGSLAAPTLATGTPTTSTPVSTNGLADTEPPPQPQSGQLVSFDRFVSKDPFKQQLDVGPGGSSSGSSSTTTTPGSGSAVPPAGGGPQPPTPPTANPTSASISVNGVAETVQVGGAFPAAQPFFKLVSLTADAAKIGIAGGSLASGAPTVTLEQGKKLTLQNTADGTRYELELLSTS